jgi:hypothetical protein
MISHILVEDIVDLRLPSLALGFKKLDHLRA